MSEIPADIIEAVDHFSVNYVMPDPSEVRADVARLILDERDRCAAIAHKAAMDGIGALIVWRKILNGQEA